MIHTTFVQLIRSMLISYTIYYNKHFIEEKCQTAASKIQEEVNQQLDKRHYELYIYKFLLGR